jgi:hypothetical protein
VSLKLYRPGPEGLEPATVVQQDYRTRLRSRRWRPAALTNPEARPASAAGAVVLLGGLALIGFVIMVVGYSTGFWH